jgi:aspartate-semialdehyde dehydrogenase
VSTAQRVAIVGATGAVGREMIRDLEASALKDIEVRLFASPRSKGAKVLFRGKTHEVEAFSVDALKGIRWVLMSAGGAFSKEHSPALVAGGATVIDNSSAWRMDDAVPLVVPEVNAAALGPARERPMIVANPNCSTIQMVVALKPLADRFGLEMVQVATYQSVSGTGQKGIAELSGQLEAQMKFQDPVVSAYAQPIAFNLLPGIDVFDAAGHCNEEVKMVRESRKILGLPGLDVLASTVRVPTFHCHGEMVNARLTRSVTRTEVLNALRDAPGLVLNETDDHKAQPTPRAVTGDPRVFVSRVRLPYGQTSSPWVQFWNVADNLKKGAATNAVQILEKLTGFA